MAIQHSTGDGPEELNKKRACDESKAFLVAAFYGFADLPDFEGIREVLLAKGRDLQLCGTVLVAGEGVNGTIAGAAPAVDEFISHLRSDPRLGSLDVKYSHAERAPFQRWKVRLKKEIVTLGVPKVDPTRRVGTYVEPADWNALITRDDVIVIDTRNHYETAIGTFRGAVDPETETFRQFPEWVDSTLKPESSPKVAMYCTGGIRCEKATNYLLQKGFANVYHLKGGILRYLEEIPPEESLWEGDCFVFDERIAVNGALEPASMTLCSQCQMPVSNADLDSHTCARPKRERMEG